MKSKFFFSALMTAVIIFSGCVQEKTDEQKIFPKVSTVKAESNLFAGVENKIYSTLNDGTEYAVFLAYPKKSSECYIYNNKPMRSASMIKVFILASVMEKVQNGEISLDETIILKSSDKVGGAGILAGYASGSELSLREVLRLMITESDNTATNIVIDRMGMDTINNYISKNGYSDTILRRKMMDMDAIYAGRENFSSVKDLGSIFTKIYNHNCVNETCDEIMIEFLKGQTDTDCFPSALPGKVIAHKTGALSGLYDDGGIIYNGENDAVLVIMTENFTSEYTAIEHMKMFARAVIQ
ncbi:MAG: serine hydrolase [Selenomonadaceae bacterium]|nr:serine hydrolase [Selenomonadaceae bacterium]